MPQAIRVLKDIDLIFKGAHGCFDSRFEIGRTSAARYYGGFRVRRVGAHGAILAIRGFGAINVLENTLIDIFITFIVSSTDAYS
jgi:hypothetical protein